MRGDPELEILLVEDDADDVDLMLQAFRRHGVAKGIHVARDGAEALDFMFCRGRYAERQSHGSPTLVVLDLKLPKLSGLEVLQHLKGDSRTRKIPAVVLTSSREQADIERSYELGANSYIVKPVGFEKFASAIARIGDYWLALNESAVRQHR